MNAPGPMDVVGSPITSCAELSCGLIMPISAIDGCSQDHWSEVREILLDVASSVASPRIVARMVSDADEVGVIQKRIIQALYSNDIVICDVSCKNPNVMFELGLRLAFDRPTIIIKDDKTDYSFDTSVVEHLEYPRDLRFGRIVEFKKKLASKIVATVSAYQNDPDSTSFLKSFGTFKVSKLHQHETTPDQLIMESLADLQRQLSDLRVSVKATAGRSETGVDKLARLFHAQQTFVVEEMCREREKVMNDLTKLHAEISSARGDAGEQRRILQAIDQKTTELADLDRKLHQLI